MATIEVFHRAHLNRRILERAFIVSQKDLIWSLKDGPKLGKFRMEHIIRKFP